MAKSGDKFVLRLFDRFDYGEYSSWWTPDKPPIIESLPPSGLVSGDMKSVGFLALTDCDFAIITWWYTNPENTNTETYRSMKKLIQGLLDMARIAGKTKVFCYTTNRGMIRLLESLHFNNFNGHLIVEISDD